MLDGNYRTKADLNNMNRMEAIEYVLNGLDFSLNTCVSLINTTFDMTDPVQVQAFNDLQRFIWLEQSGLYQPTCSTSLSGSPHLGIPAKRLNKPVLCH